MEVKYPWPRHWRAIAGAVLALVVFLVDVVLGLPSKDSLALVLMLFLAGLLFDVLDQLAKQEYRVAGMFSIGRAVLGDTLLGKALLDQITHYEAIVDSHNSHEIILDEARSILEDTVNKLSELTKEEFRAPVSDEIRLNRKVLKIANKNFLATCFVSLPPWWELPRAKKYLEEHEDLVKRKCSVKRVFIIGDDPREEAAAREEGHRQRQLGIYCYIARSANLRPEHQTDFIIADDTAVSITHLTGAGVSKGLEVSYVQARVREYKNYFKEIIENSEPVE